MLILKEHQPKFIIFWLFILIHIRQIPSLTFTTECAVRWTLCIKCKIKLPPPSIQLYSIWRRPLEAWDQCPWRGFCTYYWAYVSSLVCFYHTIPWYVSSFTHLSSLTLLYLAHYSHWYAYAVRQIDRMENSWKLCVTLFLACITCCQSEADQPDISLIFQNRRSRHGEMQREASRVEGEQIEEKKPNGWEYMENIGVYISFDFPQICILFFYSLPTL